MKLVTILSAAMLSVASAAAFAQDASTMRRGGGEKWLGHASEYSGATTGNRKDDLFTGRSIDPGWVPPVTSGPKGPGENFYQQ